ncbi:MAG: hypothetical protein NC078_12375 [Ruminococcus sp.]|nr:hypothetical protein [Ruminococcus sp.]
MDKKMDEKGFAAVDRFLDEIFESGKSDTVCPYCKTKLQVSTHNTSYEVRCQTDKCLKETFRGI